MYQRSSMAQLNWYEEASQLLPSLALPRTPPTPVTPVSVPETNSVEAGSLHHRRCGSHDPSRHRQLSSDPAAVHAPRTAAGQVSANAQPTNRSRNDRAAELGAARSSSDSSYSPVLAPAAAAAAPSRRASHRMPNCMTRTVNAQSPGLADGGCRSNNTADTEVSIEGLSSFDEPEQQAGLNCRTDELSHRDAGTADGGSSELSCCPTMHTANLIEDQQGSSSSCSSRSRSSRTVIRSGSICRNSSSCSSSSSCCCRYCVGSATHGRNNSDVTRRSASRSQPAEDTKRHPAPSHARRHASPMCPPTDVVHLSLVPLPCHEGDGVPVYAPHYANITAATSAALASLSSPPGLCVNAGTLHYHGLRSHARVSSKCSASQDTSVESTGRDGHCGSNNTDKLRPCSNNRNIDYTSNNSHNDGSRDADNSSNMNNNDNSNHRYDEDSRDIASTHHTSTSNDSSCAANSDDTNREAGDCAHASRQQSVHVVDRMCTASPRADVPLAWAACVSQARRRTRASATPDTDFHAEASQPAFPHRCIDRDDNVAGCVVMPIVMKQDRSALCILPPPALSVRQCATTTTKGHMSAAQHVPCRSLRHNEVAECAICLEDNASWVTVASQTGCVMTPVATAITSTAADACVVENHLCSAGSSGGSRDTGQDASGTDVLGHCVPRSDHSHDDNSLSRNAHRIMTRLKDPSENACGRAMIQLPCTHCFHVRCLQRWVLNASSCPMCRCCLDSRQQQ